MDTLGHHCVTCRCGGDVTTWHNALRNVLYTTLHRAGLSAHLEHRLKTLRNGIGNAIHCNGIDTASRKYDVMYIIRVFITWCATQSWCEGEERSRCEGDRSLGVRVMGGVLV